MRRNEYADGLADHLLGRIPILPRRGGIPVGHDAVERLPDDRIVRGFHHRLKLRQRSAVWGWITEIARRHADVDEPPLFESGAGTHERANDRTVLVMELGLDISNGLAGQRPFLDILGH